MSVCTSVSLSICQSVYLSVYLSNVCLCVLFNPSLMPVATNPTHKSKDIHLLYCVAHLALSLSFPVFLCVPLFPVISCFVPMFAAVLTQFRYRRLPAVISRPFNSFCLISCLYVLPFICCHILPKSMDKAGPQLNSPDGTGCLWRFKRGKVIIKLENL